MSSPPKSSPKSPPKSPATDPATEQPSTVANETIEVDDSDAISAYAQSTVTDTTSLKSSILQYKWENGRRYHSEAANESSYWGPNDERQQVAEDCGHQVYTLTVGGLSAAPISEPERVLDVGTGTGAWAIEFADENPSSEVTGIDISPIQPDFLPPNCRFEVDDINKPWTFDQDYFDYVHVRCMTGSVPNWTDFYKHAIDFIKPGGWVEQVENSVVTQCDDGSLPPGAAFETWSDTFSQMGEKLGVSWHAAEEAYPAIKEAGFVNVTERVVKVPLGPWAKDKRLKVWGEWFQYYALEGLEGFIIRGATDVLGWSYEEAQVYLSRIRQEIKNPRIHTYYNVHIVYGQKPY